MKIHYKNAAGIIALLFVIAAAAAGFCKAFGPISPAAPAEAKTLFLSSQYFTVTFLLSMFDGEMPLYYLFSHFAAFIPGAIYILRFVSFVCFVILCSTVVSFVSFRKNGAETTSGGKTAPADIFAVSGVMCAALLFSWRAAPAVPGACLISLSFLYFARSVFNKNDRDGRLYFIFTLLSLYTLRAALPFFVAQCIFFFLHNRDDVSVKRNLRNILVLFVPGLAYILLSAIKSPPEIFHSSQNAIKYASIVESTLYSMKTGPSLLAEKYLFPLSIFFLTGLALPVWSYLSLRRHMTGDSRSNVSLILTAVSFPVLLFVFAGAYSWHFRSVSHRELFMSQFNENAGAGDAALVLSIAEKDEYYYYRRVFERKGIPYVIAWSPMPSPDGISLGKDFPRRHEKTDDIRLAEMKSFFLGPEKVWVWKAWPGPENKYSSRGLYPGAFDLWIERANVIERKTAKKQKRCHPVHYLYTATRRSAYSDDGILLDMFVNGYHDNEKALKLALDPTFTPDSLRSYFWNPAPDAVEKSARALVNSCGADTTCVKFILGSIVRFSSLSLSEDARDACLGAVRLLHDEKIGAGEGK